jgi:hypothetical protein
LDFVDGGTPSAALGGERRGELCLPLRNNIKSMQRMFEITENYLNGDYDPYTEKILIAEKAIYFILFY